MKVLGITAEGDSGAAVVEDGRLLSAVNEERLCRMKLVSGFPRMAIVEALRLAHTEMCEVDAVLVASTRDMLANELRPFEDWFRQSRDGVGNLIKKQLAARLSWLGRKFPPAESAYYAALAPSFWHRRRMIRRILRREFEVRCPIRFIDHHFAHLTSAYFTSGFRNALAVSIDGGGDGRSALVYAVRNGKFHYLHEVSAYNSLGNYYAYITHLCGFKAMKHEGKITGLAAYGEPKYRSLIAEYIRIDNGSFKNIGGGYNLSAVRMLERALPPGWKREDLAASIQLHFETLVSEFVEHWLGRSKLTDVVLAGGVFANVRVNQRVHELPGVTRVFVHPHMSDGGLSVGAAFAACIPGVLDQTMTAPSEPLKDVYLGSDLPDEEIDAALRKHHLSPEPLSGSVAARIADLLADGCVVARAAGRMEYGPRALGNRSILYQPADRSVNDWLNARLHRTEFMPFAPATLYEQRERCFEETAGAVHAAEFMTITFDCTPWMRNAMEGVVHVDGTARPQLVRHDRNLDFYQIIEEFQQRSGLPAIINTSFNMHEEPIVCSADDCVRAFLEGNLDYLAIGSHLLKHPKGITHELRPVRKTRLPPVHQTIAE